MKYIFQLIVLSLLLVNCSGDKIETKEIEKTILMVSSKSLNINATENSTSSFEIATNIEWTAASDQSWLKLSIDKGSESTTVTLTAMANTANSARTANITVTGKGLTAQTITVTQGGILSAMSVSGNSLNLTSTESSTATFDITSNVGWTLASNQTWLTADKTSGTGTAKIMLTATANSSTSARSATVTITGVGVSAQTITITQSGSAAFLNVSATALTVNAAANSTASFDIASNVSWTVQSSQNWLAVSTSSGTGNAKITLTPTANDTYTSRKADVVVLVNGIAAQTITVTQACKDLAVNTKPNWTPTSTDYQYSMTYIANVSIGTAIQTIENGDELAAFVGTECRGTASIVSNTSTLGTTKSFYLLVKGNQTTGEKITFKYYQKSSSHIFDLTLSKDFVANQNFGTPDIPYSFEVK